MVVVIGKAEHVLLSEHNIFPEVLKKNRYETAAGQRSFCESVHPIIHPGSVLGKRTEFRLPPNDPFGGKVGYVNFFLKKNTSVFLKLYVHFKKMVSVKPYGKTL